MEAIERRVWSVLADVAALEDSIDMTDSDDFDGVAAFNVDDDFTRIIMRVMRAHTKFDLLWDRHDNPRVSVNRKGNTSDVR